MNKPILETLKDIEKDLVVETGNKAIDHIKRSILRYKGLTIDDKIATEISRHIMAIIPELKHMGLI